MLYLIWILGVLVASFFIALIQGLLLWALASYLAAGLVYYLTVKRRPRFEHPLAMHSLTGVALLVLIWPYACYNDDLPASYFPYRTIRSPRFNVYYGKTIEASSLGESKAEFVSWNDAVAFAQKQARESGSQVRIFDTLRYKKDPSNGSYYSTMYQVLPTGDAYELSWTGAAPKKIV